MALINMQDPRPDTPQVDEAAALAALDGSRELLREMARIFSEDAPQLMRELEAAVEANDGAAAHRAIHSLKGMAATFYARPTVELAQRLEQVASNDQLRMLRDEGVPQLHRAVDRLSNELAARGLSA